MSNPIVALFAQAVDLDAIEALDDIQADTILTILTEAGY